MPSHFLLKMSLSAGYWVWDEPTDDPPPCPHPALVPIPHRLFAPEYISPFKVPCPWYLSIFAPKPSLLSAYPPIPWSLAPKFEYFPRGQFIPAPQFSAAARSPSSWQVPYTGLAPLYCYVRKGNRYSDRIYWPFLDV